MNATLPRSVPLRRAFAGRATRLVRGAERDAAWARPGLLVLLGATAALYLWQLGDSGYANEFYAAAAQAGSLSWKAWFFGALDPASFITVDKPPASLWLTGLSVRLFGLSSWSILVPQALCGVASVGLLHATVRRVAGAAPGLAAGALLALTPVAALMFRFNNPDALLVLLLIGAAYALTRGLERASTGLVVLCGSLVGLAFLTKMLQAFLVLPAFALVWLVAAPTPLRRRVLQVLAGGAAVVASAGWWVAAVELWPAASRPFIGGSTSNSVLDLIFGYNGLSRLTGTSGGPGGPGGARFGGQPGVGRLFNDVMAGEISWLLPAAALALVAGLWLTRRAPRVDATRAALLLWGAWLVVTAGVFSLMNGIIHPYYTVALAPAIAALVAIGGQLLWRERAALPARAAMVLAVGGTAAWTWVLLDRAPSWHPELRYAVVGAAIAAAVLLALPRTASTRLTRIAAGVATAIALLGGPAAYSAATAATPHTGPTPASGPAIAQARTGPGGPGGPGGFRRFGGTPPAGAPRVGGGAPGAAPGGAAGGGVPGGAFRGGTPGGFGGRVTTSSALVSLLQQDAGRHTWAAATTGSNSAAALELSSGQAVMAIGGFSGSDPAPTLSQLKALVAAGRIHWYVGDVRGGRGGPGGGNRGTSSSIANWVSSTFTSRTVGGQTIYDLTQPKAAARPSGSGA